MPELNKWGADPEKYERLATPFESREEAQRAVNGFIDELRALREKYHVAEIVCQTMVYVKTEEDGVETMVGGAGWGNQIKQARLARLMADHETDAALEIIRDLAEHSELVASLLVTDPKSRRL